MRVYRTGIAFAVLLSASTAFAGTPGWIVSESSGKVSILSTGTSRVAIRGGQLSAGDFVTTGTTGRAVLVRGEEYLVVAPNSRIRIAPPAQSGGLTQIIEHFGNVIYKIKKMTMPHFAVETPFLAAVVKGTTFSVTVTEKGAAVQVVEGRVEVATRDGGAAFMVLPGDIGSVGIDAMRKLKVQGHENRIIESTVPATSAPAIEPITASLGDDSNVNGGKAATETSETTLVVAPVSEGPVRLGGLTGGLVEGDSSLNGLVATVAQGSATREIATASAASPTVEPSTPAPSQPQPAAEAVASAAPVPTEVAASAGTDAAPPAPEAPAPVVVAIAEVPTTPAPPTANVPAPVASEPSNSGGNSGNAGSGGSNSGNGGSGTGISGSGNTGNGNSGNGHSENGNSGNGNSGNGNSGKGNAGNGNSGNGSSGSSNSGNGNSGKGNSGKGNSGSNTSGTSGSGNGSSMTTNLQNLVNYLKTLSPTKGK